MAPSSVAVKIEKPGGNNGIALVEINDPNSPLMQDKQKVAGPKQFTWVLFLKAQRALGCIPWLVTGLLAMFVSVKKRIAHSDATDEDYKYKGRLYKFLKALLAISVVALVVEIIAYFQKWDLSLIRPLEVHGAVQWCYMAWLSLRVDYAAPFLVMLSKFCIVLFMIQSLDRLVLCLGWFWIKFKKLMPVVEGEAYDIEDASSFPMVLVQIPMCNEKEVKKEQSSDFLLSLLCFC